MIFFSTLQWLRSLIFSCSVSWFFWFCCQYQCKWVVTYWKDFLSIMTYNTLKGTLNSTDSVTHNVVSVHVTITDLRELLCRVYVCHESQSNTCLQNTDLCGLTQLDLHKLNQHMTNMQVIRWRYLTRSLCRRLNDRLSVKNITTEDSSRQLRVNWQIYTTKVTENEI